MWSGRGKIDRRHRPTTRTLAPSWAKRCAMARPMPTPAPVTTDAAPARRCIAGRTNIAVPHIVASGWCGGLPVSALPDDPCTAAITRLTVAHAAGRPASLCDADGPGGAVARV